MSFDPFDLAVALFGLFCVTGLLSWAAHLAIVGRDHARAFRGLLYAVIGLGLVALYAYVFH